MHHNRQRALLAAFVAVVVLLAGVNAVRFAAAGHDYTFIMLWSGRTFGLRSWFVNFNFEPQEISSSWIGAWAGTLAFALAPGAPLLAYKVFGALAGLASMFLVWRARERLLPARAPAPFAIAVAALTLLSPTFGYWVHGGLETPYQSLFFVAWIVAADRWFERATTAAALALAAASILVLLTRTEGFWIAGALVALAVLVRDAPAPRRRTAAIVGAVVAATVVTFVLRRAFTGALWPNPVYAKVDTLPNNVRRGLLYLADYYRTGPLAVAHLVATIYAAALVVRALRRRTPPPSPALLACAILVLGQEAFCVAAGGNWMEYFRFLSPTVLPKTVLLVHALEALRARANARTVTFAVVLVTLAAIDQHLFDDGTSRRPDSQRNLAAPLAFGSLHAPWAASLEAQLVDQNGAHRRDARALQPFIDRQMGALAQKARGLRIATYQMGYFPYAVRQSFGRDEVELIDTAGLDDRDIARTHVAKSSLGLVDGFALDRVLAGEAGELSAVVLARRPNTVYVLDAEPPLVTKLEALGFHLVWNVPGAKVFFRKD